MTDMARGLAWLPPLVRFANYGGQWDPYLDSLYEFFQADFVRSRPVFRGQRLHLKRHPLYRGKEATFWHLISEGPLEPERLPDLRRCERIRWPRPVIENHGSVVVRIWPTERNGERRICLWLEELDYVVVLAERNGYLLLWTAYVTDQDHQREKLRKDFERATSAPEG